MIGITLHLLTDKLVDLNSYTKYLFNYIGTSSWNSKIIRQMKSPKSCRNNVADDDFADVKM